jgi:hypothetical protein
MMGYVIQYWLPESYSLLTKFDKTTITTFIAVRGVIHSATNLVCSWFARTMPWDWAVLHIDKMRRKPMQWWVFLSSLIVHFIVSDCFCRFVQTSWFVTAPIAANESGALMFHNFFLGIYTNLSIWYKLIDKTYYGAYISLWSDNNLSA